MSPAPRLRELPCWQNSVGKRAVGTSPAISRQPAGVLSPLQARATREVLLKVLPSPGLQAGGSSGHTVSLARQTVPLHHKGPFVLTPVVPEPWITMACWAQGPSCGLPSSVASSGCLTVPWCGLLCSGQAAPEQPLLSQWPETHSPKLFLASQEGGRPGTELGLTWHPRAG